MPPTAKITVEQEGEPSVTLHIDPAEPPVSLGDLLKRAKAAREGTGRTQEFPFANISYEELRDLVRPPPGVHFVTKPVIMPDPESDLEDVLDSYRLAGKLCGLQVFAVDHVVCWTGDIEDAMHPPVTFRIRMKPAVTFPMFHDCHGANALEDAAKWLREQLDPGRFNTSYNLEGLRRSDGSGENITESRE